jgi:hypothetical protein
MSFPSPSRCQADPDASQTPRVSLTPSRAEIVTQTDMFVPVRLGKPVPFPLLLAAPPAGEISATPHAKVLRPSHRGLPRRIPSPATSPAGHCQAALSPRTAAATASPLCCRCCARSRCNAMDKALGDKSWVESPLPLSWCTRGCRLGQGIASPFARLGSMCWHAHVRRVAALLHPPVQLVSPITYGQNTTSCALHEASKSSLPSLCPERACTLCAVAPSHRPVPSPPQLRVSLMRYTTI